MSQAQSTRLKVAFGFAIDDLQLNREGKLGRGQRKTLIANNVLKFLLWSALILLAGAYWSTIMNVIFNSLSTLGSKVNIFGTGQISQLGLLLAFFIIAGVFGRRLIVIFDMLLGQVTKMEGRIRTETISTDHRFSNTTNRDRYRNHERDYLYYVMDDERFEFSSEALDAVHNNGSYRVYYLPRSRQIVGIEGASS